MDTVVLTGWQRYMHGAALCELLPVGLPTLVHEVLYLRDWHSASPQVDPEQAAVSAGDLTGVTVCR